MICLTKILNTIEDLPIVTRISILMLSLLAPLKDVIHVIIFLVFVDMITSIYYQMQNCKKTAGFFGHVISCFKIFESHKIRRTVSKMFFYVMAMIAFYVFDCFVLHMKPMDSETLLTLSLTNIAAILICVTELTSITSNISKITNNPIFNTIMRVFKIKLNDKFNIDTDEPKHPEPKNNSEL